jgi:hypothetical protein
LKFGPAARLACYRFLRRSRRSFSRPSVCGRSRRGKPAAWCSSRANRRRPNRSLSRASARGRSRFGRAAAAAALPVLSAPPIKLPMFLPAKKIRSVIIRPQRAIQRFPTPQAAASGRRHSVEAAAVDRAPDLPANGLVADADAAAAFAARRQDPANDRAAHAARRHDAPLAGLRRRRPSFCPGSGFPGSKRDRSGDSWPCSSGQFRPRRSASGGSASFAPKAARVEPSRRCRLDPRPPPSSCRPGEPFSCRCAPSGSLSAFRRRPRAGRFCRRCSGRALSSAARSDRLQLSLFQRPHRRRRPYSCRRGEPSAPCKCGNRTRVFCPPQQSRPVC